MNDSLIINARRHLRWHQRLFSDASTAMLWGVWLWLWRPLLSFVAWLGGVGASVQPTLTKFIASGTPVTLEGSVVALVGTSGTLLLWNLLPASRSESARTHTLRDYAAHFELPEQQILSGRAASVCVVHHDEHGRITRIDTRA